MILKLFLFWRLALFLVIVLAGTTVAKVSGHHINPATALVQWDSGHYLDIAKYGYRTLEDYAFFPLFPFLVRTLSPVFLGSITAAGLVVANINFFLFLLFFYKLVRERFSKSIAFSTVVTFLTFPTAFFGVSFYSESTFLLFCVLTFYFLDKKDYGWSAPFAILASLTRLVGIVLSLAIFYSYFARIRFDIKKPNLDVIKVLLAPIGFVAYSIFLAIKFNDPFRFLSAQVYWQRSIASPITTIANYIHEWLVFRPRPLFHYLDLLFTVVFLIILVAGIRKIPSSWWIFSMLVILIPASTTSLVSMSRFALASLGAFVIVAEFLEEKPQFKRPLWGLMLLVQALLLVRFASGIWTA